MAGGQFLSGRILAQSLVPEPKTSLKCSITSLVSGTKLRFSKKKITFPPPPLSFEEAFGSSSLTTIDHFCRGICGELLPSMRPRHQGSAHDVILTGLDEEGDSTNEEMPPLEPLEGAAQLGEVWLCGHERRM